MALWDSPRQREAYGWFGVELANLRAAFRWAADQGDLDTAATIATYTTILGVMVENFEPIAWAEELIEPARAADHPRLAQLYVHGAQCHATGRIDDAVGYLMPATSYRQWPRRGPVRVTSLGWRCVHATRSVRAVGRVVPRAIAATPRPSYDQPRMSGHGVVLLG